MEVKRYGHFVVGGRVRLTGVLGKPAATVEKIEGVFAPGGVWVYIVGDLGWASKKRRFRINEFESLNR